ncbi:laminin subunit alpha-1 [Copidosoma floridanum]|uniref:laminin subunit alpha-1 n=1 Tax=Copidosoma floridanum TaxID=29053 RepID=UPI000C6FA02B|nr:laminin subunit alpha-1 [Copidosoma floridanum]
MSGPYSLSKSLKNGGLFPSVFNVAAKAELRVNATCGEDGPETYCKPAETSRCSVCDSRSPDPNKRHHVNLVLDSNPSRWWQSPTLAQGDDYEFVTILLDLKQAYSIAHCSVLFTGGPYSLSKSLKNGGLFPSVFNVAAKAELRVNATCGEDGPETYCKPAETSRCSVCDSRSPDPNKRHHVNLVLDSNPSRWWQSPTLAQGDDYEFVTILLDLKQTYQIEYVIVKAANSPRPAAWILEKSVDGENFRTWQYYAPSDEECWTRYSMPPTLGKPTYSQDDEVICTSFYSRLTPMENGEIHTQLVNGRPGALNHSQTIQDFTEARYVRIRLQGFRRRGDAIVEKNRAFYSIREINIGGRCLCSGHASKCKSSPLHKRQECECERHTCGEKCDKCCPMYNQVPWKPGTSGKGFHCEKCNCHGHATSCQYDPEVAEKKLSMDVRGKFRGGGVCSNCSDHTTGINCETCEAGYYRPDGVLASDPEPCVPCKCHPRGSTGFCIPDDSFNNIGKAAGACECKLGYSGHKCNQCSAGFRQFPDCLPCPCDSRGVLPSHDCEGDCICKAHVDGEFCDRCKPGYFALSTANPEGCLPCFCSGLSNDCSSAKIDYNMISTLIGWQVSDINASRALSPSLQGEHGWPTIARFEVEYRSPYWLAPKSYTGNRLSSYGSNLTFLVSWKIMRGDTSDSRTSEPDVVLIGKNGVRIAYGDRGHSGEEAEITVPLLEDGWYHVKLRPDIVDGITRFRRTDYRGDPVTRQQFLEVLTDVEYLLLRAKYHTEQNEGSLKAAVLPVGEVAMESGRGSVVEMCSCPRGYTGLSCELCDWGYVRAPVNSTDHKIRHECVKCDCNGHAATCNLLMGECGPCEYNTVGPKCDRCAVGYYGDATRGTSRDCFKCACPLDSPTNNFSPNCQVDNPHDIDSGYVCTQCPLGYTGDHCESCDVGFYGNPLEPGNSCKPCPCFGSPCDQKTGRCLDCRGNTEGWQCERCKEAHYGDPTEFNCLPCACDPLGSTSHLCDLRSGQCICRPLHEGRDCSLCIEGFGNVTAGCVECDCGIGAADNNCDPRSGLCSCNSGVVGSKCDACDVDHFGLSFDGCTDCNCNSLGSVTTHCDIVSGQCQCKKNVIGRQCSSCLANHWGLVTGAGCSPCECDPVGSHNATCHDANGQCHCKPGIGRLRCDSCLPGYYGFSQDGCQPCEPCDRPGHICDQSNGRCSCPALSTGERCDRCRPGSYDLRPGLGCRGCGCSLAGSQRQQCAQVDGQCPCREGFEGRACDRCAPGHYDYPHCRPCGCDPQGTVGQCDGLGQCPCKTNAVGRRCNECSEGTFGLSADNPDGCTECFCFGRTSECRQASLSWGQRRLPRPRVLYVNDTVNEVVITSYGSSLVLPYFNSGLNKTSGLYVVPGTDGDVTLPVNFYRECPIYWQLPDFFLKDKVTSYGGFLRFTTITDGGYVLRSSHRFPLVQLQGNGIVLEHFPANSSNDNGHVVRLHESSWRLKNRADVQVTREILMVALQNVQRIFVKTSDFTDFSRATLLEASIDTAVPTAFSQPLANGIEQCDCPTDYNGTSCQDPSQGYYRWVEVNVTSVISGSYDGYIELVGRARACECNGRSELCDPETGHCLGCGENTSGPNCEICAESFYGDPNFGGCKECPCPQTDKKFSNTCVLRPDNEVVCVCKPGYAGARCERCSYGHYGYPSTPGGRCEPCNCNEAGSASDECDTETGQCNCRPGSTGRDCSQCTAERHVFVGPNCVSCNDNCTGLLLDDLDDLKYELINATTHISAGYIAPPWEELAYMDDNVTSLYGEIKARRRIEDEVRSIPWDDYKLMAKRAESLLSKVIEKVNDARIIKSQSGDIQNNAYSLKMEIEGLKKDINDTIFEVVYYGNDDKKVEIKKVLKEAKQILNEMKLLDLPKQTKVFEVLTNECTEYIDWLDSLLALIEPLDSAKEKAHDFSVKMKDMMKIMENTMETMFSYDTLYNEINMTYEVLSYQQEEISDKSSEINGSLNKGQNLIVEAKGCVVDSENNIQDIPEIKNKLSEATTNLSTKEQILYRLNYEYKNKYVIPATSHAQNLSNYVDQYVGLFSETRAQAANPLKASQAYKNIVDGLMEAEQAAYDANDILDDVHRKVYLRGPDSDTLLDNALDVAARSTEQVERTRNHYQPIFQARGQLENQKQAVSDLKISLNSSGTKDNQINLKLRELQSDSRRIQERLNDILKENLETAASIVQTRQLISDYQQGIIDVLNPKLQDLKREGDSKISLASEKLAEAQSNIKKADAKLTSMTIAAIKRQEEFDKWNGTLANKLQILKDKIAEARNTADGIRVSIKSAEGKRCTRSYRVRNLQPSSTTTISMTFAIPHNRKEGILFYLASSINDDFMALEMFNRKIRFVWNVGGGVGMIIHPEVLETGSPENDSLWYRIEAERIRHIGKLSVIKQLTKTSKYSAVINETSSEFGLFDVTSMDRVWLGGLPELQMKPPELLASNGLPGCVHQLLLNGKQIGLWNFISNEPDDACRPCVEGVENIGNDLAYSFNGEGYAVRSRVISGPYNKYIFGVSINFKTYDENAILFLAIDPDNPNGHVMIFLRDGRVVLHIVYGNNISMEMTSSSRYNTGNWTKVDAFRQFQSRKNTEKCSFSVDGEYDKKIGAPTPQPRQEDIPDLSNAKYFFGGVPPSFRIDGFSLPTHFPFLGCMSNIVVQEGYDPMAEHYYGVEPGCRRKRMNTVGFYGDGYLELPGHQLRKKFSSISFSFRTLQSNAMLLLSTFQGPEEKLFGIPDPDQDLLMDTDSSNNTNKDNYYSVAIVDGHVQFRINGGRGELILLSNGTFDDGKYHMVTVTKRRKDVELRIDDAYQVNRRLPTSAAVKAPESGGLYIGGLPHLINNTKMVFTNAPLIGAIKDIIFDEDKIVSFDEALRFEHAYIGRAGPLMGKDSPAYSSSASLSRGLSTQPEGCQKIPYYSLEPGALKFGDKPQSHTQLYLNFENFWNQKKVIEFDFRTYYPNGLLFITPGIRIKNYLVVMIRDSQLLLIIKSKQKKEMLFKTPFNDGNWHHVTIGHDGKKLSMIVDTQTPMSVRVPKKIGLTNVMYIGGIPESGTPLPEQIVSKLETLKGCIRGLKVNGNIYDMVGSTSRPVNVGQCFPNVESGAYFQDEAYAVYKKNFELGPILELQLEFRTSELTGVLLSITSSEGTPSLSLELYNGKILMSSDFGYNQVLHVEQEFKNPYTVCDNRWHRIQAIYNDEELTLKVDELEQKYGLPTEVSGHFIGSVITNALYIGGIPDSAPKGTLMTRDYFNGCLRNVQIGGERRDWTDMYELYNIHLNSCPVQ